MEYGDSPELGLPSKGTPFRFRLSELGVPEFEDGSAQGSRFES